MNGALLEKENAPVGRKSIDSRKRFCYKAWLRRAVLCNRIWTGRRKGRGSST